LLFVFGVISIVVLLVCDFSLTKVIGFNAMQHKFFLDQFFSIWYPVLFLDTLVT